MLTDAQILQIIPATGWKAVYFNISGKPFGRDLVCFALVETPKGRGVIGLEPLTVNSSVEILEVGFAHPSFLGYCGPNQSIDNFENVATQSFEAWKKWSATLSEKRRAIERERVEAQERHARVARDYMRLQTKKIDKKPED